VLHLYDILLDSPRVNKQLRTGMCFPLDYSADTKLSGEVDAQRMGCHPEGPGQPQEVGMFEPREVQQGQVQDPAPGSRQPPLSIQAGG